jgi:hypothetical protein
MPSAEEIGAMAACRRAGMGRIWSGHGIKIQIECISCQVCWDIFWGRRWEGEVAFKRCGIKQLSAAEPNSLHPTVMYGLACQLREQSFPLTSVRLRATVAQVRIRNFVHKGLKKLYADDVAKSVPPDAVDKLRKMLAFLTIWRTPKNCGRCLPGKCIP